MRTLLTLASSLSFSEISYSDRRGEGGEREEYARVILKPNSRRQEYFSFSGDTECEILRAEDVPQAMWSKLAP